MAGVPRPRMIAPETARRPRRSPRRSPARLESQSLLDVVDSVIDKGLALDAEIVLGLADIDLVYLRVGALLAAADRVFQGKPGGPRRARANSRTALSSPSHTMPLASSRSHMTPSTLPLNSESVPIQPNSSAADESSRSVIRLVLTLVEFVRQLLERQAVRRVRERTLTPEEIERLGTALMRLESTVHELAERHGLDPADLNLDLGPLGTLR